VSEDELKVLGYRFWQAYAAFREAWTKTGGGIDLELKVRDAAAELIYQRRCTAAHKGALTRRRKRHG
jgi:hypothetical protein